MTSAAILIVEDEMIVALDLQDRLQRLGYSVSETAMSGQEALKMAEEMRPDLIFMDIGLKGDMDGIEVARQIHARFAIPIVFLTAYGDANTRQRAEATSPAAFLAKPFDETELARAIENGLGMSR